MTTERPLDVRLDPRVAIDAVDLRLQADLSMACYRGYLRAQALREAIDALLARGTEGSRSARHQEWMALRGPGEPGDPDILYVSIHDTDSLKETVVGLQHKLLFLLNVLQGADARPTSQAVAAVRRMDEVLPELERRWAALK